MEDNSSLFGAVLNFVKSNVGVEFESPRKHVFQRKNRPQNFTILEADDSKEHIKIKFKEKGTPLLLGYWRFKEAIESMSRENYIPIGGRINENYSKDSLEGVLKKGQKKRSKKSTATKTAPHIADLLVLGGIAELGFAKSSSGRKVQGIKLR